MVVRIVRLGTPRCVDEGLRIGTVRRPPRGVPKSAFAAQDWYDLWFPNLSPSVDTMKIGQAASTEPEWARFVRAYRQEMSEPERRHDIALLAALSKSANFSVGCYCEDAARCHRSVLLHLLRDAGAELEPGAETQSG